MNLVIKYVIDFCDCHSEHVLCFRYESAEAWLVHFEEKLRKCFHDWEHDYKLYGEWQARKPNLSVKGTKNRQKAEEKYNLWKKEEPNKGNSSFEMCNHTFYFWDFYTLRGSTHWENPLPEVHELNEWFELCLKKQ